MKNIRLRLTIRRVILALEVFLALICLAPIAAYVIEEYEDKHYNPYALVERYYTWGDIAGLYSTLDLFDCDGEEYDEFHLLADGYVDFAEYENWLAMQKSMTSGTDYRNIDAMTVEKRLAELKAKMQENVEKAQTPQIQNRLRVLYK